MSDPALARLFAPDNWQHSHGGPRYKLLAQYLARHLGGSTFPDGAALPPERLCAEWAGVSRVTWRKTLAYLADAGLITQRRGAGTFVTTPPAQPRHSLSALVSFTESLRSQGFAVRNRLLHIGLHPATPAQGAALGLAPHALVLRLDRLRIGNERPIGLERATLPAGLLPAQWDGAGSLYQQLDQAGHPPQRAEQRVRAVAATPEIAQHLDVPAGTALLQIDRIAFCARNRAVEQTCGTYRSDLFDFATELRLSAPVRPQSAPAKP